MEAAPRCLLCGRPGPVGVACAACGLPRPSLVTEEPIRRPCPRCHLPLTGVELGDGVRVHGCTSCRWTFLPPRAWKRIFEVPGLAATIEARVPLPTIRVEGLLPLMACPTCGMEMDRARFAATSNIVIDACRLLHGVWIDAGEITKVLAYAEHKARIGEEAAVREAEDEWARSERMRDAERARLAAQLQLEQSRVPRTSGMSFVTALVLLLAGLFLVIAGMKMLGPSGCNPKKLRGPRAPTTATASAPAESPPVDPE